MSLMTSRFCRWRKWRISFSILQTVNSLFNIFLPAKKWQREEISFHLYAYYNVFFASKCVCVCVPVSHTHTHSHNYTPSPTHTLSQSVSSSEKFWVKNLNLKFDGRKIFAALKLNIFRFFAFCYIGNFFENYN